MRLAGQVEPEQVSHHVLQSGRVVRRGQKVVGADGRLVAAGATWLWMDGELLCFWMVARCWLLALLGRGRRDAMVAGFLAAQHWLPADHHGEYDRPNGIEFIGDGIRAVLLCHG